MRVNRNGVAVNRESRRLAEKGKRRSSESLKNGRCQSGLCQSQRLLPAGAPGSGKTIHVSLLLIDSLICGIQ